MGVYVDNALIPAEVPNGRVAHRSRWSHLMADTPCELHQFATEVLGLKRAYFQDHWPHPHYDLTEGKRAEALAKGAQEIEWKHAPEVGRWLPPLLVTSSRDGVTRADVEAALRPRFDPRRVLVAGGARGGDRIAAELWTEWGGEVDVHPVSPEAWQRSRGAGYDRNSRMVSEVSKRGGECVAIVARCTEPRCTRQEPHGTHGASHCADLARKARMQVEAAPVGGQPSAWQPRAEAGAEAERHDWQRTEDPDQKRCDCGITAARTRNPEGKGWTVTFHVPGLPSAREVPPCSGPQHRPKSIAEPTPGPAAEPTPEPPASRQDDKAAGRVIASEKYSETVQCGCGARFQRPHGATCEACLSCQTAGRLAAAGINREDPGLTDMREWNQRVSAAAARQAECEPARVSGQAAEPEAEPGSAALGLELAPDAGR